MPAADRSPLLPVAEAQARLFALARPVAAEAVPLDRAVGRWIAADVAALRTQPAADLSAMDGYAIRFADLPSALSVIGESAAGRPWPGTVGMGRAVRIFTGAAMPRGTDTVLIQEEATREGTRIRVTGEGPPRAGAHVRRQGLDFFAGDRLIAAGERVTPARVALAATAGHGTLMVNRPIRVAILPTGDELVPPGSADADPLALPEGNGPMLAAMLASCPVEVTRLGIVPDDLDALTAALRAIRADIIVTTGGASVGDHDLVRPAIQMAGGDIDFWRIAIRPGKPMLAGRIGDAVVLGLPGNPVSAFVTAQVFLLPLIATMAGARHPLPRLIEATLAEPLPANDHRQDYIRATFTDGRVSVANKQDSSMLAILSNADGLVVRAPHAPPLEAGARVAVLPIA